MTGLCPNGALCGYWLQGGCGGCTTIHLQRCSVAGAQVAHWDTAHTHMENQPGGTRLVLVTCWPFDSVVTGGPLRYVVKAASVSEDVQPRPAASISSSRRSTSRDG